MEWTPGIIQSLTTVAVLATIGLAVLGQVRWRATQEWRSLAEAREDRIKFLEDGMTELQKKVADDQCLQSARNQALEAQISELQRLNLDLQRQLSKAQTALENVKEKQNAL